MREYLLKPVAFHGAKLPTHGVDEKTEGVVENVSGNGNHGAVYGGMVGAHFGGADDYVEILYP